MLFDVSGEKIEFQLMKLSRGGEPGKFDMILIGDQVIPAKVFYRALTLLLCGQMPVAVNNFKIKEDRRGFVIMFGTGKHSFGRLNFLKIIAWALTQALSIDAAAASQALGVAADLLTNCLYEKFPPANYTEIREWEKAWAKEDKEPVAVD